MIHARGSPPGHRPRISRPRPAPALALLLAAHTGIYFSGSITAILFNTPGAPESAATTFDGYPMTEAGRPARALGISATATTIGGWIGVALLMALIPLMDRLTTLFYPSEFLALAILAIVLIGQMRARSVTKGIISGAVGLMISFVGYDLITGVQRFTTLAAAMALIAWQAVAGLHSAVLTGVLVTAWGAGIYGQTSPRQHRLIAVAPGEPALVIGLNSSAIYAGIGIGTVLGGLLLPAGVAAAGLTAAIIAAAADLYLMLTRRYR